MRAVPEQYEMVSPGDLGSVLKLMASEPGRWLPVAGGTEVMVQYSAGRLPQRNLINLWNLPELRRIEVLPDAVVIGGGCTFAEIRAQDVIAAEFPMLAKAAAWIGGIANQNRATLAGNLANASPAADSPPALLAYEAEVAMVSARGTRRIPYKDFHLGYKQTALAADELILGLRLPRRFAGWREYVRKVGARNAQAISKVCIAAQAQVQGDVVEEIRMGMGSVAPVPLRLVTIEDRVAGRKVDAALIAECRQLLDTMIAPIDDIRSTMEYRRQVAGNVLEDCLRTLAGVSR
ncbi:MAG TPA: FAD binding domain-containing protein [Acidobacteriaceae bacterium]|nr:FAD binding domain-containing protein [Acidobacteriaceae bacterium]